MRLYDNGYRSYRAPVERITERLDDDGGTMKLEDMIQEQYDFQREYAFDPDGLTMEERERWLEKFVVHTTDQSMSVLHELNWKDHEPNEPVDYDQATEEIVDTLKYVFNMAVVLNVTPEELEAEFRRRSKEVRNRQESTDG
jgi:hypothetical protein